VNALPSFSQALQHAADCADLGDLERYQDVLRCTEDTIRARIRRASATQLHVWLWDAGLDSQVANEIRNEQRRRLAR